VAHQRLRGAFDELADDHGGAAGDGGTGVGDDGGVGLGDEDLLVGDAEGLRADLGEDGVGALAELGGGDEDARAAFRSDLDFDEGVEAALAGAGETGAVHEGGEAYSALDCGCGIGAVELGALGVVVGFLEGAGEQVLHVDRVGEVLAGGGLHAGREEVAAAEFFGREADDAGDLVHVAFEREEGLGCAEAAKGPVGRDVGGHRLGADSEVRPVVGAGRVDAGAGEDDGRERDVGAAVDDDLDLAGEEFAVARDGGAVARARGMALGGGDEVFGAVVADFDGVARLHREQRRVRADDGGEVLLAAEGPAGLGLDDAALFGG
jgi:hypothetical protein